MVQMAARHHGALGIKMEPMTGMRLPSTSAHVLGDAAEWMALRTVGGWYRIIHRRL
jgi:hypothetical protein